MQPQERRLLSQLVSNALFSPLLRPLKAHSTPAPRVFAGQGGEGGHRYGALQVCVAGSAAGAVGLALAGSAGLRASLPFIRRVMLMTGSFRVSLGKLQGELLLCKCRMLLVGLATTGLHDTCLQVTSGSAAAIDG